MHPTTPADEIGRRLDELRHAADVSIARFLRCAAEAGDNPAEAIANLDHAAAVMHNDTRIYRQRLLAEIPKFQRRRRHLRVARPLTSAADTAAALGFRDEEWAK